MIRVYLDTNIFQILKKNPDSAKLNMQLKKYADNLLYCYSHAHMLDLQRDKTDKKLEDLVFMEQFVNDNYLIHYWGKEGAWCYKIKPKEAFDDLEPVTDIQELLNFDNLFSGMPELKAFGDTFKSLLSLQTIDVNTSQMNLPGEIKSLTDKFIHPGEKKVSVLEMMNRFLDMYSDLSTNDKSFRQLRKFIIQYVNPGMNKIKHTDINFNDALKETVLQKSFTEYVTNSLNPDGKKEITKKDFFLHAYAIINLLGIDQEKNKKAKFTNTFHDSLHAYYGAFCDYVVSDDEGFLIKAKLLYKFLDIETKVLHIDEFSSGINLIADTNESTVSNFITLLRNDLKNGIVLKSYPSIYPERYTIAIKAYHLYLGFFNHIKQIFDKQDGDFILLYASRNNYSTFYFYKEIEIIVNKALSLFGTDIEFKGNFIEKEETEIRNKTWTGRQWEIGNVKFVLEINLGTGSLNLIIGPI